MDILCGMWMVDCISRMELLGSSGHGLVANQAIGFTR